MNCLENSAGRRPERPPPTHVEESPPLGMDLVKAGIKTIVWTGGYRPDYSFRRLSRCLEAYFGIAPLNVKVWRNSRATL
jgi:hypothetical protein